MGLTLEAVAQATGISASYLARIERGHVNPTFDTAERIATTLGLQLVLDIRPPVFLGSPPIGDLVHARCSAYVDRRLRAAGWSTAREVPVVDGRYRGWIDLLAFDPTNGSLVIIEIKTRLDDVGALERQLSWYERSAASLAGERGWSARSIRSVVLFLASEDVERTIRTNRDAMSVAFPRRGDVLGPGQGGRRGMALIDPRRRRRDWIMRCRVDGRRGIAPYRDYADAAVRLAG